MATIAHAAPPLQWCPAECSPRFRMVKHNRSRWDVQEFVGCWIPIYSDDSAPRAYGELQRVSAIAGGDIVCASCARALDNPRLRRGEVLCDICHARRGHEAWFRLIGIGVLCVIWVAILNYASIAIHHLVFGGARW